jgi:pimeloyl-ACP methyl ester carboxylesterase
MIEKFNDGSAAPNDVAIVFVHGFTGDLKGTWGKIPDFLQTEPDLSGWDLFGFGYQSRRRFDILRLWSADARLEEIAIELFSTPELRRCQRLAFVAHSMGGLVVERALVKYPDLRDRTSHVVLFGTPSAGLVKATLLSVLKQQIRNMSASGDFIRDLRREWTSLSLDTKPPFHFLAIAGEQDQFVPPESSLGPFPEPVRRVIPGNHLSMLRADSRDAPCVRTLADALTAGAAPAGARSAARLAVEEGEFQKAIEGLWPQRSELDDSGAILLSLALDAVGRREDAIEFLEGHSARGTDVLGVLAGRYKRRWTVERRRADVEKAMELYGRGYSEAAAKQPPDHDQAYYHGINLAYLELAYGGDYRAARQRAEAVLADCAAAVSPKDRFWLLASEGDALMILGRTEEAMHKHAEAARHDMNPWQALSIQEQAIRTADLCGLTAEEIERLSDLYEGRVP